MSTLWDTVEIIDYCCQPVYSGEVLLHFADIETFIWGDIEQPRIIGRVLWEVDIEVQLRR